MCDSYITVNDTANFMEYFFLPCAHHRCSGGVCVCVVEDFLSSYNDIDDVGSFIRTEFIFVYAPTPSTLYWTWLNG